MREKVRRKWRQRTLYKKLINTAFLCKERPTVLILETCDFPFSSAEQARAAAARAEAQRLRAIRIQEEQRRAEQQRQYQEELRQIEINKANFQAQQERIRKERIQVLVNCFLLMLLSYSVSGLLR